MPKRRNRRRRRDVRGAAEEARTKAVPKEAHGKELDPSRPRRRALGLERSDLELVLWLMAGFIVGVALKVTTASAVIIAIVVLVAIGRLYYEKTEKNPRPSLGMVPMFLLGWVLGLLVRAVTS